LCLWWSDGEWWSWCTSSGGGGGYDRTSTPQKYSNRLPQRSGICRVNAQGPNASSPSTGSLPLLTLQAPQQALCPYSPFKPLNRLSTLTHPSSPSTSSLPLLTLLAPQQALCPYSPFKPLNRLAALTHRANLLTRSLDRALVPACQRRVRGCGMGDSARLSRRTG
jgi:hypothetical protein